MVGVDTEAVSSVTVAVVALLLARVPPVTSVAVATAFSVWLSSPSATV